MHAFDVCYYPCLDATRGRPFGLYLHGNEGTEGAERAVEAITTWLGWVKAVEHVVVSSTGGNCDMQRSTTARRAGNLHVSSEGFHPVDQADEPRSFTAVGSANAVVAN
jgi:hypothetical protein